MAIKVLVLLGASVTLVFGVYLLSLTIMGIKNSKIVTYGFAALIAFVISTSLVMYYLSLI